MKIVIDIDEKDYKRYKDYPMCYPEGIFKIVGNGTPLPKGHSFIAICDSNFPITEEVIQKLKDTVFVGNEECNYCFDMTEIIEAESEEEE